jgi:hypothetical protein
MKAHVICALALTVVFATACSAEDTDNGAPKQKSERDSPSIQFGDYRLGGADAPKQLTEPTGNGLVTLERESKRPFLGLTLTKTLPPY